MVQMVIMPRQELIEWMLFIELSESGVKKDMCMTMWCLIDMQIIFVHDHVLGPKDKISLCHLGQ